MPPSRTRQLTSEAKREEYMNTFFKAVMISSAVFAGSLITESDLTHASTANLNVKVQINDSLISFPDAQPFIDHKGNTQIPLRFIAENLKGEIDYKPKGNQVFVTIKLKDKTITLTTGSKQASVNGKIVNLNTSPVLRNGRAFVPLRFISQTFSYPIRWDGKNRVAVINEDGKKHATVVVVDKSSEILKTAKKYIGVKYKWGGTTPSGFDCSGFVHYVFNKYGIDLPHSSQAMHDKIGTAVARSALKPGDLVFFITNKVSTSHVGIYMGDNKFISATSKGVTIASLSSSYWSPKYNGAKRLF